jgi:hypothetical protein
LDYLFHMQLHESQDVQLHESQDRRLK